MIDKKAKKILFDTYWSKDGWKNKHTTALNDFLYAKEHGVMFDPITISYSECINRIVSVYNQIDKESVVKAFLSSLSSRKIYLRSAIASYHTAACLSKDTYIPRDSGYWRGTHYKSQPKSLFENEDLNVLNFERIKFGGVRIGDLLYTLLDLSLFLKEDIGEPRPLDIQIFKEIINTISLCPPDSGPGVLRNLLKNISLFKSNKYERDNLMEVLACIGVLAPKSYDRNISFWCEWTYSAMWRGKDGYNEIALNEWFGKYIEDTTY